MDDLIYGRNAVMSALEANEKPVKVFILATIEDKKLLTRCDEELVTYELIDKKELDRLTHFANHQGVVAQVKKFRYTKLDTMLRKIEGQEDPLLVILDGINDPQNFGSIIRSCEAFGVQGIIIGERRAVEVTPVVIKVATGAQEFIPISKVVNLAQMIDLLKEAGYWIVASDGSGKDEYDKINYSGKIALIIGSEGEGISSLLLKKADFVSKIKMRGHVNSLNAAVATACFLSMITVSREK